ncbi:MAG: hypothetical protein ACK5Y2_14495 [Bdellovibrionales bacterium]
MILSRIGTALFLIFAIPAAFASGRTGEFRNLRSLYANINKGSVKLEQEPLVLKDYHLVVSASTQSEEFKKLEIRLQEMAARKTKAVNVVFVYDHNGLQNWKSIVVKTPQTKTIFEFFDGSRSFYRWFVASQQTGTESKFEPKAILIGPDDHILFNAPISSLNQLSEIENKIKVKPPSP